MKIPIFLKRLGQRAAPRFFKRWQVQYGNTGAISRIHGALSEYGAAHVMSGPFAGMKYVDAACGSAYFPKLIGSYEVELHEVFHLLISRVQQRNASVIVDIGCAEGYYAVGMAIHCPQSHVYAFDCDAESQRLCGHMAQINNVEGRLTIQQCCAASDLNELDLKGALIICDCEGCEYELLKLDLVQELAQCDILVELHAPPDSSENDRLLSGFATTHSVQIINTRVRQVKDWPVLSKLDARAQSSALEECRPGQMQWAVLLAHQLGA